LSGEMGQVDVRRDRERDCVECLFGDMKTLRLFWRLTNQRQSNVFRKGICRHQMLGGSLTESSMFCLKHPATPVSTPSASAVMPSKTHGNPLSPVACFSPSKISPNTLIIGAGLAFGASDFFARASTLRKSKIDGAADFALSRAARRVPSRLCDDSPVRL
jgi:hypothetical protein